MRRAWRAAAAAALVGAAATAAACSSTGPTAGAPDGTGGATVLAASSLAQAFTALAPGNRYSFAGSDQLAFQVTQGAPADVVATASPRYTQELFAKGLVERPRAFATNRLVVVVPVANRAAVRGVRDLARPGVKLVIGDAGVPVGAYARDALRRLGLGVALRNVVSEEQDAGAIAAKVALGEADAGVVYATDARPVRDRVATVPVPAAAQPVIRYEVAVVTRAPHRDAARAFVRRLLGAPGRHELAAHGFRPPPAP
ncbi:MAG: molybdate ABC transporter substrate-binding protein [Actinomycetota bacterium]